MTNRNEIFPLDHAPHLSIVKGMPEKHCIRAYRAHTGAVCLQIRMENRYVTAVLSLQQAKDIGLHLVEVAT